MLYILNLFNNVLCQSKFHCKRWTARKTLLKTLGWEKRDWTQKEKKRMKVMKWAWANILGKSEGHGWQGQHLWLGFGAHQLPSSRDKKMEHYLFDDFIIKEQSWSLKKTFLACKIKERIGEELHFKRPTPKSNLQLQISEVSTL